VSHVCKYRVFWLIKTEGSKEKKEINNKDILNGGKRMFSRSDTPIMAYNYHKKAKCVQLAHSVL